ncbi:hypothetical protein PsalN5692_00183 [Piscirickettsia salmonis]|nr:hypothetical protein PsalN5692_00183 [Piscirickettsia salmonis]
MIIELIFLTFLYLATSNKCDIILFFRIYKIIYKDK